MNWRLAIEQLNIDSYVSHTGITVVRLGRNRFLVLQDGYAVTVGGGRTSVGMAIALALECVTGIPQLLPCVRCGKPREVASYCREHYNAIHAPITRRYKTKRKSAA